MKRYMIDFQQLKHVNVQTELKHVYQAQGEDILPVKCC